MNFEKLKKVYLRYSAKKAAPRTLNCLRPLLATAGYWSSSGKI